MNNFADKKSLFEHISKQISINATSVMQFISKSLIAYYQSNNRIYLTGNCAMDEIMDKNYYIAYNMPFSNCVDVIISGNDEQNDQIVLDSLNELIENIHEGYAVKMISILNALTVVLNAAEIKHNADINYLKPTINDYYESSELFHRNKFKIGQKISSQNGSKIYFIYLDYKGLSIPVLETTGYTRNIRSFEMLENNSLPLLNVDYVHDLFKHSAGQRLNILEKNIKRETERGNYNSDTVLFKKNRIFLNLAYDGSNTTVNDENVINDCISFYDRIIKTDEKWVDAVKCYSKNGDRVINGCLLQQMMFNESDLGKKINVGNDHCNNYTPNEILTQLKLCANKALNDHSKNSFICNVVRFTNPTIYGNLFIEHYNEGDLLTIPTLVSTSHFPDPNLLNFTSLFSPMVIFYIRFSNLSMDKLLFMESNSMFPHEKEVLFMNGIKFKIVRKRFRSIKFSGLSMPIQKLVIEMVIDGDNAAEQSLMDDYNHNWEEGDADSYENLNDEEKNGGGLKDIQSVNILNRSTNNDYFVFLDEIKTLPSDKKMPFDVLFPYYLRNDKGIPIQCDFFGCKYLDNSILNIFPELEKYVSSSDVWNNLNLNENVKSNDISNNLVKLFFPNNKSNAVFGGFDLQYTIYVIICVLFIVFVYKTQTLRAKRINLYKINELQNHDHTKPRISNIF
jgi:hypothetical protein